MDGNPFSERMIILLFLKICPGVLVVIVVIVVASRVVTMFVFALVV